MWSSGMGRGVGCCDPRLGSIQLKDLCEGILKQSSVLRNNTVCERGYERVKPARKRSGPSGVLLSPWQAAHSWQWGSCGVSGAHTALALASSTLQQCVTYIWAHRVEDFKTAEWQFSEFLNAFIKTLECSIVEHIRFGIKQPWVTAFSL